MSKRPQPTHGKSDDAFAWLHSARNDHDPSEKQRLSVERALQERIAQATSVTRATHRLGLVRTVTTLKPWLVIASVVAIAITGLWAIPSRTTQPSVQEPRAAKTAQAVDATRLRANATVPPAVIDPNQQTASPVSPRATLKRTQRRDSTTGGPPGSGVAAARNSAKAEAAPQDRRSAPAPHSTSIHPDAARASTAAGSTDSKAAEAAAVDVQLAAPRMGNERTDEGTAIPRRAAAPAAQSHIVLSSSPLVHEEPPATDLPPSAASASNRVSRQREPSELALMQRIQAALREHAPLRALSLSAEHAQRWPHGTFEAEREGVRALAACQLQLQGARDRAQTYLAQHPQGTLAPRVRATCR